MPGWGNFAAVIAKSDKALIARNQEMKAAGTPRMEVRETFKDNVGNKRVIVHADTPKPKPKPAPTPAPAPKSAPAAAPKSKTAAAPAPARKSAPAPVPAPAPAPKPAAVPAPKPKASGWGDFKAIIAKSDQALVKRNEERNEEIKVAGPPRLEIREKFTDAGGRKSVVVHADQPKPSASAMFDDLLAKVASLEESIRAPPPPASALLAELIVKAEAFAEANKTLGGGEKPAEAAVAVPAKPAAAAAVHRPAPALKENARLRAQLEKSEDRVSGLVAEAYQLRSDVGALQAQASSLTHQLSDCQQYAGQIAGQLQWTAAQHDAVYSQFRGLEELVAASGSPAEGCTGGLQCTSCTYHLQLNLQLSRRARSTELAHLDDANLHILRLASDLQDAQLAARRETAEDTASGSRSEVIETSDCSGSDSELEIIGVDVPPQSQPATAADDREVTVAAEEQPTAAVAPTSALPPVVEGPEFVSAEDKTEAARKQPPTTRRREHGYARRSFLYHLTGMPPDRKFVPSK
ncbi:hypothetical protein K491DRAFT_683252 [Lophiostoma macrostomum CBS 122681]|uniref:Uncharacterized protein n=1 Tax=Lophiostoma macrostomum CBS 122681 TaxID=1314788 RepID=A0A6A6SQY9_9PLEO|nr:hypothetical protein K491DRAFT_683252 [Lophiostoma macrostomum CBS 122681]